ncbi:hypothetical protein MLPF_2257 [Mycobacterium lepromatosis]|nr:hypothetical protein MLPF_2257 [Mycobacterium lepromatosis]
MALCTIWKRAKSPRHLLLRLLDTITANQPYEID